MDFLKLRAILGFDSSEYNKGLNDARDKANSAGSAIGNGLKTAAKMGAAALSVATATVGAFATSSVKAGSNFDKSMSQVAATMGKTTAEIENLRNFAQEMGRTTAFSATQAADALNYMALAGYDAETSMKMLPNVLNLAAAGNMDLARASDMVTDTQTAFGIELERTSQLVDEMAKAASTGNTSVEQLGDAFLTVGGLAQELNGGFVYLNDGTEVAVDGVQELEIALTAMANAGIKGSEAGTHMRNMLLKLSSPTSEGTKALEAMGVKVFDTEGKMRSLSDVFVDLSNELDNMTQEQKIQTISDLFNTRDLASAEALLNAVSEDWDKIGESILDAEGAASKMAETQLDNLAGDVTLFKSALEGAQIVVSDKLTPTFRDFVKFGTNGISELTNAFERGGLDGAINKFGMILSDGITMIVEKAPQMVSAGVQLLSAFIKGFTKNKKKVFNAAKEIIKAITGTISKEFPSLKSVMDKIQRVFDGVFGFIEKNGPLIKGTLKGILTGFLAYTAAITVFNGLQKGIGLVTTAVKLLNGELALTAVMNPYAALATAIGVTVGAMTTLVSTAQEARRAELEAMAALSDETIAAQDHANEYIDSLRDIYDANMDVKRSIEEQLQPEQNLINELRNIVDENGHVKEGYEDRAQVITDELANAFNTEISYQDGVILKYDEVLGKLDDIILKKKAEALLEANKATYQDALADQILLYGDMQTAQEEYNGALKDYKQATQEVADAQNAVNYYAEKYKGLIDPNSNPAYYEATENLRIAREEAGALHQKLDGLAGAVTDTSQAYYANQDYIVDYNKLLEDTTTGAGDVQQAMEDLTNGIIQAAPQDVLKKQAEEATTNLQNLLNAYDSGVAVSEQQIADATAKAQAAVDALNNAGKDGQAGYAQGLEADTDVIDAARKMVEDGLDAVATAQDSHSPSVEYKKQGIYAMSGYGEGMLAKVAWLQNTVSNIINKIKTPFTKLPETAKTWGSDMMSSFIKGIEEKIPAMEESVTKVASIAKDNLGHSHPKEGPMADDYKWMPDMMELFTKGIRDNEKMLHDTVTDVFDFGDLMNNEIPIVSSNTNMGYNSNSRIVSLLEEIATNRNVTVVLEGDADRLFRVMQSESRRNKQITGQEAFT